MKMNNDKAISASYGRFALMMAASFVLMYVLMFSKGFELDHLRLSLTRTYVALLMVGAMSVMMLLFMWRRYRNRRTNYIVLAVSAAVVCLSLFGLRTQAPVGDIQWMKGMIPHHSSAIMTSSYADIKDPEARRLADEIIRQQEAEIAQMKAIIERLQNER